MRSIFMRLKQEAGQSTIMIALALVVLCGVAALVVDTGMAFVQKGQLQNAADAAALAAAHALPNTTKAKSDAVIYAEKNGIEPGHTTATTPYKSDPKRVEVVVTATVNYTFARVLGIYSQEVSARAVAEKTGSSGGAFGYAIFSGSKNSRLGLFSSSMTVNGSIHGNQEVMMNGSTMTVNGNVEAAGAFSTNGSKITITGTAQGSSATAHGSNITARYGQRPTQRQLYRSFSRGFRLHLLQRR
jgi:Flp pilus assembly protein TadG